jgi:hypothetical protein
MIRILFLWFALLSNTPAIAETRVPQRPVEVHLSLVPLVKKAAPAEMVFRMSVSGLSQKVPITRWRIGKSTDTPVSLMVAPEEPPRAALRLEKRSVLPGVTLATIKPAVFSDYNLSLEATGVLATDPGPIGPRVGLRHGDLVLAVNGAAVFGLEDVRQTLRRSGQTVSIEILRGTRRTALTFRR